jgi:Raf kinase inhibitor-like YbhB/YbcL family protein
VAFTLESSAFTAGNPIPKRYTGDGDDCSPPLVWRDPPRDTQNFVLVMEDPDAPSGLFHHWTLLNIPGDRRDLPEAFPGALPISPMRELQNGFGHNGYGGPLPPHGHGRHRYVFRLIALPDAVELNPGDSTASVLRRILPRALGVAELIGTYER